MPLVPHDREVAGVLICGLGSAGRRHLKNLKTLGCQPFVLYRTFRATIADELSDPWPSTSDLEEALSYKPRVAVIANPTSKHLEVALAAARAGCHLFIEKPLSNSLAGCRELVDIVCRNRLVTMIGCQFRFHPLLLSLRRQLSEGRLGEVLGARAEWGEYLPDWHPWEDYRASYSAQSELGGGVILTLIHPLDYLMWLFGPVSETQAAIRRVPSLQTGVSDDWADITVRFAGGAIGQIHLDYVQKPSVHQLTVWGDRGRATCDFHDGTLAWQATDGQVQREQVPDGFERNTMFVDEMREFLAAVDGGRPSSIPLEHGIAALKVALEAKQCAHEATTRG